jgi:IclR family transcriptional regulator, KDG regulon repressor
MINRCHPPERAILGAVATTSALSSVDRALSLLEELARHGPLGATELANRTGCAKATAFRLARTLQARGFVVQNADSTYRLGPRCLLLATGVHTSFDVRREALPTMEALRDETGETVQLTVLEGSDVVYVEQVTSRKPVRSVGTMGQRAPAHTVSGGLAQLALLPFDRVRALLPNPLPRPTAASIPSLERLAAELDRVRARGFAVNRGGFRHDVGGVGTCITDVHGRPVACINICVPLYRLDELGVDRLGALVVRAAAEVSRGSSLSAGAGAVGA